MRGVFRHKIPQRKSESSAEIHKQIIAVYDNVMNRQNVTKWGREFSEGRTDVQEEQRSGRPSLISDELLQEIEGEIRANRRVTKCLIPQFMKL
jgi:transposase